MSLSLLLVLLIPFFLIPSLFLPRNKLIIYTLSSGIPAIFFIVLFFFDTFYSSYSISNAVGEAFMGMFSFFTDRETLSLAQKTHITYNLTCLFFYMILYLVSYFSSKFWFIGSNPNIHKAYTLLEKFILSALFFVFTYGVLFLFIVEIREIIPLSDGFLSFLFNIIYKVGA
jgi:hypothetical protein